MNASLLIRIFFFLFSAFIALCLGLLIGAWLTPRSSGLAGPAIVLGYGVSGLVIGLILTMILNRLISLPTLRVLVYWLGGFSALLMAWFVYLFMTNT